MLAAEGGDRLGRGHRVALDEGEGGGALEQLVELGGARPFGGSLREPVLDHAERGIRLRKPRAQLRRLRDRDAPVVDREDRICVAQALGDLVDERGLVFLGHLHLKSTSSQPARPPPNERSPRAGGLGACS